MVTRPIASATAPYGHGQEQPAGRNPQLEAQRAAEPGDQQCHDEISASAWQETKAGSGMTVPGGASHSRCDRRRHGRNQHDAQVLHKRHQPGIGAEGAGHHAS